MIVSQNKKKVSILYSGHQFDYLYGILSGFYKNSSYNIEVIDAERPSNEIHSFTDDPNLCIKKFLGLRRKTRLGKLLRWVAYYFKLTPYLLSTKSDIIHIEWLNHPFVGFEEILLPLIIKIRGRKIVFKVHDISSRLLLKSSGKEYKIKLNFTKRFFYRNVDIFIVHNNYTQRLLTDFGVAPEKIRIIRHGVNNFVPFTNKSKTTARTELGLNVEDKVVLFFGNISPYKNIESLIDAVKAVATTHQNVILLIAGNYRTGLGKYKEKIEDKLNDNAMNGIVKMHFNFIPNQDIETYFAAADVLCLPYKFIFQSGVLFLAYRLGAFVISKNVGGIPEDILLGKTGWIYENDEDLPQVLTDFFYSDQYLDKDLKKNIRTYANEYYGWDNLSLQLSEIYNELTNN